MTWTTFLLFITGIYFLYYLLNICYDLFGPAGQTVQGPDRDELFFTGEIEPQLIYSDEETEPEEQDNAAEGLEAESSIPESDVISSGTLESTGAVDLKQLFALAQAELIEYTKDISY